MMREQIEQAFREAVRHAAIRFMDGKRAPILADHAWKEFAPAFNTAQEADAKASADAKHEGAKAKTEDDKAKAKP